MRTISKDMKKKKKRFTEEKQAAERQISSYNTDDENNKKKGRVTGKVNPRLQDNKKKTLIRKT